MVVLTFRVLRILNYFGNSGAFLTKFLGFKEVKAINYYHCLLEMVERLLEAVYGGLRGDASVVDVVLWGLGGGLLAVVGAVGPHGVRFFVVGRRGYQGHWLAFEDYKIVTESLKRTLRKIMQWDFKFVGFVVTARS